MTSRLINSEVLGRLRNELPSVAETAYFNAGTLGPWPRSTHAVMRGMMDEELSVRQPIDLWDRLDRVRSDARAQLARLASVSTEHVSLQAATHPGINTALWGLDLQPGDVIVTTDEEHPGVNIPLRIVKERLGATVEVRPFPSNAVKLTDLAEYINNHESLVTLRAIVISHASWLTGGIADICKLRKLTPPSIRIIVDGAQSAGAMDIADSVAASDAYTISGQKWTLGPNGSGALILADPDAWRPTYGGFFAVENPAEPSSSPYRNTGERFEVGMESMIPLAGLTSSLQFLLDTVGIQCAQEHSRALNTQLRADLTEGVCPSLVSGPAHILCIALKDGGAPAVCEALMTRGFQTRPVGDCVVRASLGFWNTPAETSALARELCDILTPTTKP